MTSKELLEDVLKRVETKMQKKGPSDDWDFLHSIQKRIRTAIDLLPSPGPGLDVSCADCGKPLKEPGALRVYIGIPDAKGDFEGRKDHVCADCEKGNY